MEVECLALKDLTSPRKSLSVGAEEEEEDEGQTEQKVKRLKYRSTSSNHRG